MKHTLLPLGASLLYALFTLACNPAHGAQGSDWPLEIEKDGALIVIYQPQPESLHDDKLTARVAVSFRRPGESEPLFGAAWIDARVSTDRDARTVTMLDLTVPDVKLPDGTPAMQSQIAKALQAELPGEDHPFSLDALLTTLDQADMRQRSSDGIEHAPPKIVFATVPTVLVTIDGKPQLQALESSKLLRVVNTPFVILFAPDRKLYFLRAGERWVKGPDYTGPWTEDPNPPPEVTSAMPPPQYDAKTSAATSARVVGSGVNEHILVVTEPTELVVSDGEPKWTPIEGNELLYLANSDNDVFMEIGTQRYFLLLAGRWYASPSLDKGPWTFVPSDRLPTAFATIPPGSERSNVRAFVGGTDEARDAVLDASIPQTSVVSRSEAKCTVTYDGDPKFEKVAGTEMMYAVNSPNSVIAIGNTFYCCEQGVWFTAAAPLGPWTVCTSVPDEVHTIPPSCPVYPVSYVYVYGSTPTTVYVGYLPGYTGCYVYGPTIVYGTGWWYPGWYGHVYYPHPCTWGFAAHYDPWTCGWNFGLGYGWGVGAGWFGLSFGWGHPGWWGPSGFHSDHFDIDHHTVQFHPPHVTPHEGRFHGEAVVSQVGHDNIYKRHDNAVRNATLHAAGPAAARMKFSSNTPNNVFADHDGHVLRRTNSGWEERDHTGWKATDRVHPMDLAPRQPASPNPTRPSEQPRPSTPAPERARPSEPTRPITPAPERPRPSEQARPVAPPARPSEGPSALPPRAGTPSRSIPPRDDFERMNRAREQGSLRASGFQQRSGRAAPPAPRRPNPNR